jgi:hypothetical protein
MQPDNNYTAFLSPTAPDEFLVAVMQDPDAASAEVDLKASLPPLWKGKYVGHFHELNRDDPLSVASDFSPDTFTDCQITHLALLESSFNEGTPFYFNGDMIKHTSMLLWYSQPRNKFYFAHCITCLKGEVNWMIKHQEDWERIALPAASATIN